MARFINLLFVLAPALKSSDANIQTVEVMVDGGINLIEDVVQSEGKLQFPQEAPVRMTEVVISNRREETIEMYWIDFNNKLNFQFEIEGGKSHSISTWEGHRFISTPKGWSNRMNITQTIGDAEIDILDDVVMEKWKNRVQIYDPFNETQRAHSEEIESFQREYYEQSGKKWSNYWPRDPVIHHYHRVDHIGDVIKAMTDRSQFHQCSEGQLTIDDVARLDAMEDISDWDPSSNTAPPSFQIENDKYFIGRSNGTTYCRQKVDPQGLTWNITNICNLGPNAFRIYDFLSDDEMEHIKELGQFLGLQRSSVQGPELISADRTSQTVWLTRSKSFIINNIVRRIADMVQIPEQKLFQNASSEALQLVHYFGGELYKRHLDYRTEREHCRYITFLMYLSDVEKGGNTSFPEAHEKCRDENGYFGVQPIKGSVVFFYNLFPDGNTDPRTEHYAEPPVDSEKWMTNLWIWDKVFKYP